VCKSLVNGTGTSAECVNGRTNSELVGSGVLSCWLQVSCKCTELKCVRVPFVESRQQKQLVHRARQVWWRTCVVYALSV